MTATHDATAQRGAINRAPTGHVGPDEGAITRVPNLGEVVRAFKARTTFAVNHGRGTFGSRVWQRNYYEHVIRDDRDLDRVRKYIAENPARWASDCENPHPPGN